MPLGGTTGHVAPLSMKIIPLRWRGAGVGCSGTGRTHPRKAEAFCPSQEGIFRRVVHVALAGLLPPFINLLRGFRRGD